MRTTLLLFAVGPMKTSASHWARVGLAVACCLGALGARAQTAPAWASVWRTSSPTATSYGAGHGIALAADGSRYIAGQFEGTLTLGPATLTAGPGTTHQFLAKYSAAGVVLWATQLDGGGSFSAIHVAVDAAGNAYLAGPFYSTIAFSGTTLTAAPANYDSFLAKYDAQGALQWARQGGSGTHASSLATDAGGNVALAGNSATAAAFGGAPLPGTGICYYKFSPAGAILQARRVGTCQVGFALETALVLDGAGNAYLAGGFRGPAAFGALALAPNDGYADMFLCKLDATAVPVWVRRAGGPNGDTATAVAVDAAGNPVVCGSSGYVEPPDSPAGNVLFVDQFTAQGVPVWSHTLGPLYTGSVGSARGISRVGGVAYDGRGGCFVAGQWTGAATVGATWLSATAGPQAFVVRYDGRGNAVWATQTLGSGPHLAVATGIAADASGRMHVVGSAVGTIAFGALATTAASGRADAFVATLTPGGVLTATRPAAAGLALAVCPNPATGLTTVLLPAGGGQLVLLDALGRAVRRQALPAVAGPCPLALAGLAPGLYRVQATFANGQMARATLQVH